MSLLKRNYIIYFILLSLFNVNGQIPEPHSVVNYAKVYFEGAFVDGASNYELQLYRDSLKTSPVLLKKNKLPAYFSNDLNWGQEYWWRINAYDSAGHMLTEGKVETFSIQKKISAIYIEDTKLEIKTNQKGKYAEGLLVFDHARAIFDREGKQLWALPNISGLVDQRKLIRDIKLTPHRSITFLAGPVPVEIDFEGHVLWKAPYPLVIGTDTIVYHHDFRKYANGHYFVLGNKKVIRKILGSYSIDSLKNEANLVQTESGLYKKTPHGLLLEFDKNGKLIWYWDSNTYITDEDLNYKKSEAGIPTFGTHMNAFSVNASNTKAYVSFRDLNRIVKIDKKSKKVEFSYGEKYPSGDALAGNDLFRGQHDATITDRHSILLFNNNNQRGKTGVSSVLEIREKADKNGDLLLWKFDLNYDTLSTGASTSAGNVDELPNGDLLVCGGMLPRIIEVSKTKEVVWDAFVYSKAATDSLFTYFPQYRCHWTPQLYLFHFLLQAKTSVGHGKNRSELNLKLYNTGNCDDSYKIEVLSAGNEVLYSKDTQKLNPEEETDLKIQLRMAETELSQITIRVQSAGNSSLFKIITLNRK